MKRLTSIVIIVGFVAATVSENEDESDANPVQKVLELLSSLEEKIVKEGEEAQKMYDEFSWWCEDESNNLKYSIKTGKAEAEELSATIAKAKSTIDASSSRIEELASSIATDEADLKAATEIRDREHAEFTTAESELADDIDALGRAITILEREMRSGGASFTQLQTAQNFAQALKVLVDGSALSNQDATRLTSFIQNSEDDGSDSNNLGAPDPNAYENHSGGIIGVLEDLMAKAETELDQARKKEMNSQHNFNMLKQSLTDELRFANQEMDEVKKSSAQAAETQAIAEGDLATTSKALAEDSKSLSELHQDCMIKSQDFEAETQSRAEELSALAKAKKVIVQATGGAESQTYSLLQIESAKSSIAARTDLVNFEAVTCVKKLARRMHSPALTQLASKMATLMRIGGGSGDDPFAKVKGLISDMISRLLTEAEEDASQKAYCDKEMSETKTKKEDLEAEIDDLSTKIDKMSATSAKLKEEVADLQKELADLASSQAEMDKLRQEEKEAYAANKAEMEEGLEGVKMALKIIKEYYGNEDKSHAAAEGAASGIIGMLEVIESDFSKGLAELNSVESTAQAEYDKQTKENEIATTLKSQDVKYKTKESGRLEKSAAETDSDRKGLQTELDAVLEYYARLKDQCIAKPESYEERKKRREEEIEGLKEALQILGGEAVFLQRKVTDRKLRGIHRARRLSKP